ncbi:MAG: methylated-DNA--[protein]-cysteine S-methyltransferase [Nitrospinae bacterium]|nr:methylated-DNA--[protein]-cysteine S-methyltransferase [Nitrospinota bacterium]
MTKNYSLLIAPTIMGPLGAGFAGDKIGRVWLPGLTRREIESQMENWAGAFEQAENENLAERMARYFLGERVEFDDPVELTGFSPFAKKVLTTLRKTRWGQTVTYAELASASGSKGADRAVGGVMALNPAPLIIPCHRVVRSDGAPGGFSAPGGVKTKLKMLELEGSR